MDFHQFEYVIAVAEERSFSKAANKLYISQPSLSQYIMRLEQQLNIKLFDRSTNPLTLTYAGEKYIESAKNILNLNDKLREQLGDIAGFNKGRIKIGIPIPTERYILPLVLPKFNKKFPEIEIVIEEHSAIELEKLLAKGDVDFAIMHLPIENKKIVYEPISVEKIFLIAPPDYNISAELETKGNKGFDFDKLREQKFIMSKPGHRMRVVADEIFKCAGFKPDIIFEIRNLDAAFRFAAAGLGFAFVPENVIKLLNTNQYNNYFLIEDIGFTLAAAYRQGDYLGRAAGEFIRMTKEIIGLKQNLEISDEKMYYKISAFRSNMDKQKFL
ncbi:MAG: LysR family transcriptional regulator [Clostridiaceae bacterium]